MSSGQQAQSHVGKINYRKNLTPDLAIFRMQPADRRPVPDFKAGQFVALGLKVDGDHNIIYRPFSLSSPPEEKRYFEFYIKSASEYVMSKFTSTLFKMFEGDLLYWRNPAGSFTIEDKKADGAPDTRRLVLVASGTGLAPFISYILHLKNIKSKREIILLHGAKYVLELGYYDLLKNISTSDSNFKYLTTVSRPDHELSRDWRGNVGRVETLLAGRDNCKSQLEEAIGEKVTPENTFFHICGYAGTINAVISILSPLGFVTNRQKREDGSFDIKIETYV
ncbi:MAG TPA: FAD-binding oxidoreductase [Nitrososphaera sp.]|nr:FAD-binding oxidoreductase [Nitrososphaera sp.]HEX2168861.1 FAD-binding oxidoreductase [Nitrososphaera sp.]